MTDPPETKIDIKLPPRRNADGEIIGFNNTDDRGAGETWLDLMIKQNPRAAARWMKYNNVTPPTGFTDPDTGLTASGVITTVLPTVH